MTTEIDNITGDSALEILPPARPTSSAALATLREHADAMQAAHQLAVAMCGTDMVPDRFKGKPDNAAAAMLYGTELGLNPIQSLQNIFAVGGAPSMYARTMVALLKSHGYKIKTVDESSTVAEVHGWERGKNPETDDPDEQSRWTIERAQQAEFAPVMDPETGTYKTYTKKNGDKAVLGNMKYVTQPQEMLWAKAAATVCRRLAPDVLLGIAYAVEERESEARFVESERVQPPPQQKRPGGRGVDSLRDRAQEAQRAAAAETAMADAENTQPGAAPPEPDTAAAHNADTPKSGMRKALEKRLFTLIGDIRPPINRDDRILIYRGILKRGDITSTNDLDDVEVAKVADDLYQWSREGKLGANVTDILNNATIAAENVDQS